MSGLLGRGNKSAEVGATRTCPHCRATILDSAVVCPGCKGHLRFDPAPDRKVLDSPLRIESTLPGPAPGEAWEYSVVAVVKNERGEEIARHIIGVGAIKPGEQRTFSLSVDLVASTRMRAR
ncbi:hypothetical protein EBB59_10070 [Lysobacter pythonis]|uniref:Uncharacterized protein n=1 Tax=Solilutibacter pythonis TaxID=2483112 RepID=A0A3M2HV34_9GAMM|nr:hypothetical protein [Lysobacter pythonis]RMH90782.1 hypothetical protein EBB59_10070 [Lysobacter pythonis]